MSTVASVVGRTLRLMRVIDANEPPEAQQMENAIVALNAFMASVEAVGTAVGWSPVSLPSEEMPTAPELDKAIAYNLACELRPEYGVELDPDVVQGAETGLALMRQQVMANTFVRLELDLPVAEGSWPYGGASDFYRGA